MNLRVSYRGGESWRFCLKSGRSEQMVEYMNETVAGQGLEDKGQKEG